MHPKSLHFRLQTYQKFQKLPRSPPLLTRFFTGFDLSSNLNRKSRLLRIILQKSEVHKHTSHLFTFSRSNMILFSHPTGKTLSLHQTNVGRPVTRGSVGGYFSANSFSLFLTLCQSSGTGISQKLLLLFLAKGYHDRFILPIASN